ncbi:MAG: hypothetical protein NC400_02770 [Clostridium sp.]|nr:hypothetical protein [Clostridium sp.]
MEMKDKVTKRVQLVMDNISKEEPEFSTEEFLSLWEKTGKYEEDYFYRKGKFFKFCMGQVVTPIYDNEIIVGHFLYKEWDCNRCCLPDPILPREREQALTQINREFLEHTGLSQTPNFDKWSEVFYGGLNFGHVIVDYEKVLRIGFGGLKEEINRRLEDSALEENQRNFLLSGKETILGSELFIKRYGEEAFHLAETVEFGRAEELREIGRVCSRIAASPAANFREALQLLWFTQLLLEIESGVSAFSYGRMDQYLYPFYQKDLESGILSEDEAQELIDLFWLKNWRYPSKMLDPGRALTLGGILSNGGSGVNSLTYLMLNATRRLKIFQPKLNARIWNDAPKEYIEACVRTAQGNCGPMFYCDEISIQALEKYGYVREDAMDYGLIGCYEMAAPGKECGNPMGAAVNIGKCFELAMNNGVSMTTGEQLGPQTGYLNEFQDLKQLKEAFQKQVEYALDMLEQQLLYETLRHSLMLPHTLESVLIEGCIQKGKDVTQFGAALTTIGVRMSGLIQTADSFTAIKKLVFEEKSLSMERLWKGLCTDFAEDEALQAILINKAPKYGNDCDEADYTVRELGQYLCEAIQKRRHLSGTLLRPGLFSYLEFMNGESCAALPDGHRKGQPFANGVSPTHGRDYQGLTAMLRSAAKLDYSLSNNAATLDVKLPLNLFSGENGVRALSQILQTFFKEGGMQIQLYFLSAKELMEAQKSPEKYTGLIVRVTGYSAYFTELNKNLQDEVIMRTAAF